MASSWGTISIFVHMRTSRSLSNKMELLPKIAELEIQSVCVPGIKELVYALCCQSNEALEKTEVGPYDKYMYEDI